MLQIWHHKVFVLLHSEEELPTQILVVLLIHHLQAHIFAHHSFIKRNDMLMVVALFIFKDCYMVIIARAHIIGRLCLAILIHLLVKWRRHIHTLDGYAFYGNAFFLIEPDRIVIKI